MVYYKFYNIDIKNLHFKKKLERSLLNISERSIKNQLVTYTL